MKKIIKIDGGIGRVIALTGVISEYAKQSKEEVDILTPYPDLFFGNPNLNRTYHISHQYIFDDVIKNSKYIEFEPYNDYDYYNKQKHLIEVGAKLLLGKKKFIEPQIHLSQEELDKAKKFVGDKKIILFQPFGARGGKFKKKDKKGVHDYTLITDKSNRSLPHLDAQDLAKKLKKEGFEVIQIRTPDQYKLKDIGSLLQPSGKPLPMRQVLALLPYIKGFIGCDSFLQHAAKMMDVKHGIVFFGTTTPENLGYKQFKNYTTNKKFIWTPNRQPHNNPDVEKTNKGLMNYTKDKFDEVIKEVKSWDSKDSSA